MSDLNIGVLEGRWEKKSSYSIRPFFDLISHLYTDGIDGFLYERFVSKKAFSDTISFVIEQRRVQFLYIASHANADRLVAANYDFISRAEIRNDICALSKIPKTTLHGLFIGACNFGSKKNAKFLLADCKKGRNPVTWFAGYDTKVDWIDGTALDFMFWHLLFWERKNEGSHLTRIKRIAEDLVKRSSGLIKVLGFHIYVRKKGPGGGVIDLLAPAYA